MQLLAEHRFLLLRTGEAEFLVTADEMADVGIFWGATSGLLLLPDE